MGLAEGGVSDYVHVYIYRYDWMYCLIRPPIGEGPYHVGIFYEMMGGFSFVFSVLLRSFITPI